MHATPAGPAVHAEPAEPCGCVQVRSLTLDVKVWDEAVLGMMERIGNELANEAWEAQLLNENARSDSVL